MKKLLANAYAKALALILLCAAEAAFIFCAGGLFLTYDDLGSENRSFFETDTYRQEADREALDCIYNWYHEHPEQIFEKYPNLSILIREKQNQSERLETVFEYDAKLQNPQVFTENYRCNIAKGIYLSGSDTGAAVSSDDITGKITLQIGEPQTAADFLYWQYHQYTLAHRYMNSYIPVLAVSAAAALLLLIFCFSAAGHCAEEGDVRMYRIDSVPAEAVLAICAAAAGVLAYLGILQADQAPVQLYFQSFCLLCAAFIAASLCVYAALFSIVRRIKCGKLRETSFCGRLISALASLAGMIPSVWKTAAVMVLWLLLSLLTLMILAGGFSPYAEAALIAAAAADIAVAAAFVMTVYGQKKLSETTGRMAEGDLEYRLSEKDRKYMLPLLKKEADHLDQINEGMQKAIEKEIKSERLKTELITNVSHDIRTPLTSIISYTDLMQKETDETKKAEYLEIISRSSLRLKKLTEDLMEASKASSGNIRTELSDVSVREIIDQALGEYEEKLRTGGLETIVRFDDENRTVRADGRLLWRVLSNLLSNCVKYAQPGTRVYIDAAGAPDDMVRISVKNISRDILNISADELLERFVRGDQSRNSEGSGLGLSIARSLTELMGGRFELTVDGDLFRADIILPSCEAAEPA